jgi:hypothetical protein
LLDFNMLDCGTAAGGSVALDREEPVATHALPAALCVLVAGTDFWPVRVCF